MSVEYPDSPSRPQADLLPQSSKDASYNRRVLSSSFMVLIGLVVITTVVAFRSSPGVFQGGSKVSAATPAQIAPAAVSITKNGFSPSTVTLKVGQAVVWTNDDVLSHLVVADATQPLNPTEPIPNSGPALSPSDSYSYVFNQAGSYGYHDTKNPNFKGTVEVK
jgi:plastocyanin